nr:response regulator [uncultured Pseudogulbenkiania sp.]
MEILFVEDSPLKRDRVSSFIREIIPNVIIDEANSFSTGSQKITSINYDLIILDISLPTYDRGGVESGGRFRAFGGKELARKIMRRQKKARIVFITQYESFSDKESSHSLESLESELKIDCGENFLGLIYYDSSKSVWKEKLSKILTIIKI